MTKQKYTDFRDRNPLYRCVDCNSSRNSTAGERHGTCYDCGGKMSTAGDRTRELDKEHAVDREWRRRGVCFDPFAHVVANDPMPKITGRQSYVGLRSQVPRPNWVAYDRLYRRCAASRDAIRADNAAIEKREQRLREYGGRATFNDDRYSCENCGSSRRFTFTTVCSSCGGRMKRI